MARRKTADQLADKMAARAALEAEIKKLTKAAKAKAQEDERKRCEIAGRLFLAALQGGDKTFAKAGLALLDAGITKPAERALFSALATAGNVKKDDNPENETA